MLHIGVYSRLLRVDADLDRIVDTPAKKQKNRESWFWTDERFWGVCNPRSVASHLFTGTSMFKSLAVVGRIPFP